MSTPQIVLFDAVPSDIAGLWIIQMRQVIDDGGTVREFYRAETGGVR